MLVLAGLFIKKDFQMANLTMSPNFVPLLFPDILRLIVTKWATKWPTARKHPFFFLDSHFDKVYINIQNLLLYLKKSGKRTSISNNEFVKIQLLTRGGREGNIIGKAVLEI